MVQPSRLQLQAGRLRHNSPVADGTPAPQALCQSTVPRSIRKATACLRAVAAGAAASSAQTRSIATREGRGSSPDRAAQAARYERSAAASVRRRQQPATPCRVKMRRPSAQFSHGGDRIIERSVARNPSTYHNWNIASATNTAVRSVNLTSGGVQPILPPQEIDVEAQARHTHQRSEDRNIAH